MISCPIFWAKKWARNWVLKPQHRMHHECNQSPQRHDCHQYPKNPLSTKNTKSTKSTRSAELTDDEVTLEVTDEELTDASGTRLPPKDPKQ